MQRITKELLESRTYERVEDIRGCYYRDQTAIVHSKPFRRLKHKTQAFYSPDDDHVCTRIEHVLHVATIAATICRGLNLSFKGTDWNGFSANGSEAYYGLNEDLAYSIGIGHDLGHAPFGHCGEDVLTQLLRADSCMTGNPVFMHEVNGYRVVEKLCNDGRGLNLTYAVKDGIMCHNGEHFEQVLFPTLEMKDLDSIKTRGQMPSTWEGCIVRVSDKIAYLGRDIEDAIVAGIVSKTDIPKDVRTKIGDGNGALINHFIMDLAANSSPEDGIRFSDESYELMRQLKDFNYTRIYEHELLLSYKRYCVHIIKSLYEYLTEAFGKYGWDLQWYSTPNSLELDRAFGSYLSQMVGFYEKEKMKNNWNSGQVRCQVIVDYISGMTDKYAIESMREISLPKSIPFLHKRIK